MGKKMATTLQGDAFQAKQKQNKNEHIRDTKNTKRTNERVKKPNENARAMKLRYKFLVWVTTIRAL